MYCTMPSGTRYQIGSSAFTRTRQSVEEMANAGTSISVTRFDGSCAIDGESNSTPGRVQPTKCAESEELFDVAPGQDLGERVRASDEVQLHIAAAFRVQVAERVHRIRHAWPVDVHPTNREARIRRGGDYCHQVAIFRRGHLPVSLLPRLPGRHEDHFIEVEAPGHLAGGHQVAVMDGIEGATHHPQPMASVWVEIGSARQPSGTPLRCRHRVSRRLAVGTSLANGEGEQQQTQQQQEGQDPEPPGRNRQFPLHFGLEQRQSQRHDGSLAALTS